MIALKMQPFNLATELTLRDIAEGMQLSGSAGHRFQSQIGVTVGSQEENDHYGKRDM
jgi:hypothetical protein